MKSTKLLLFFLLLFCFSCSKKNKLESIFITPKDYYWQFSTTCQDNIGCGAINYKFEEDGYSHRYDFSTREGYKLNEGLNGSDNSINPDRWYIKKDSILSWGGIEYKIKHINQTVIVLQYLDPRDKKTECWIRFLKVVGEK